MLALLGFFVGAEVTLLKQHTYVWTDEFHLDHSQTAVRFASVARSRHVHGVRVRVIGGNRFQITGHGSFHGAPNAVEAVARQVRKAIDRVPKLRYSQIHGGNFSARPRGNPWQTGAIGLLGGLGIGLGIVAPHRRRVTAMAA